MHAGDVPHEVPYIGTWHALWQRKAEHETSDQHSGQEVTASTPATVPNAIHTRTASSSYEMSLLPPQGFPALEAGLRYQAAAKTSDSRFERPSQLRARLAPSTVLTTCHFSTDSLPSFVKHTHCIESADPVMCPKLCSARGTCSINIGFFFFFADYNYCLFLTWNKKVFLGASRHPQATVQSEALSEVLQAWGFVLDAAPGRRDRGRESTHGCVAASAPPPHPRC